jgi:TRAP-type C4-dicarboxylate transport system permease small subunit
MRSAAQAAGPRLIRVRTSIFELVDTLHVLTCWVVQACLGLLAVLVLAAVFWRYVLQDALVWTEEAGRYLMIWMGFLGAAVAVREGGHIAIDTLLMSLPPRLVRAVNWGIGAVSIAFLLTVVWLGLVLVSRTYVQRTPSLDISMAWPYLSLPVGSLLMAIQLAAVMARSERLPTSGSVGGAH